VVAQERSISLGLDAGCAFNPTNGRNVVAP
jgi:hypothetical protein